MRHRDPYAGKIGEARRPLAQRLRFVLTLDVNGSIIFESYVSMQFGLVCSGQRRSVFRLELKSEVAIVNQTICVEGSHP